MPAPEAIQIARRVLAAEGYQSVAVGPTAATFVRDVRPPGITIAAYACAIPTLGLSLFALLIRSQEQCTVTGETSRRGTALSLSGVVTTETLQDLEGALRHASQQAGGPPPDDGFNQFPTPGRGAPAQRPVTPAGPAAAPGYPDAPARAGGGRFPESGQYPSPLLGRDPLPPPPAPPARPQAPGRSAVPDPLPTPLSAPLPPGGELLKRPRRPAAFPDAEMDMTVVRPRPMTSDPTRRIQTGPSMPRWVLTLDDGRTIDVPDFALIGRDPEPAEEDPEAGLVSMIDPEMSVSKTHASFGVDDEGLWFLDRFSTNGTSVQAPGGERIGLEPGVASPVVSGSDVWIGRRHLQVDRVDD
jgi:hypothetical protein